MKTHLFLVAMGKGRATQHPTLSCDDFFQQEKSKMAGITQTVRRWLVPCSLALCSFGQDGALGGMFSLGHQGFSPEDVIDFRAQPLFLIMHAPPITFVHVSLFARLATEMSVHNRKFSFLCPRKKTTAKNSTGADQEGRGDC